MKALISPNETFTWTWVTSWVWIPSVKDPFKPGYWASVYSEIQNCQRVAEVEPNDKVFEVSAPLHWVDCQEDCKADQWYFKNNQVQPKPQDVPMPPTPVETLP